jgi:acetylcholinesterase
MWRQLPLALFATLSSAEGYNTVKLEGYGSFSGTQVNETYSGHALPHAVDAWLGMDYATQPVGDLRFTQVDRPSPFNGTKAATSFGKVCIQEVLSGHTLDLQDEACLNFNVYRTPGVPLDKKLPVLVWIHGGSMYAGSYQSFDAAAFAASSPEPIVVVNFHYRVNSLGSLPSKLTDEEGLSNLGIKDQRLFLEFVQEHIHAFGGDADAVTVGGRSAGGHSVGIHYFHNYGIDAGKKPLFARAIHQSGSVTARAFAPSDYEIYQTQFREYMDALGCQSNATNSEALKCLRAADVDQIRNVTVEIFRKTELDWTWAFQPVQGGELFEKPGSVSGVEGTFFHVPTISSSVTDEAKLWDTGVFETNEEVIDYIRNFAPALNETDLALFKKLYPDPNTNPDSPYTNSPNSTQFNRFQTAMSDYAYICPGQETSYRASTAGVPVWKVRFNTNNSFPAWQGIPHTADTKYTWNEPTTQYPLISKIYHAYLASFVLTGDPNTHRYPGSPEWVNYEPTGYGLEAEPAKQLVVQPGPGGNGSATGIERDEIRREQCLFWRDPERAPRLNK